MYFEDNEDKQQRLNWIKEKVDREMLGLEPDPSNPYNDYTVEQATEDGILRPEQPQEIEGENPSTMSNSPEQMQESGNGEEKQYKKLGFWRSQGDMLQSMGSEALRIFAPKSGSWLSNLTGGRWSEDNLWKHEAQTRYSEFMAKGLYRYGISTIALMAATGGIGGFALNGAKIAKAAGDINKAKNLIKGAKVAKVFSGADLVKLKNMPNLERFLNAMVNGMPAGAIADYTMYDYGYDGHMADMLEQDNPLRQALGTRAGETELEGRLKNVIEGAIISPFAGLGLEYILKPALKNTIGKAFTSAKNFQKAKTIKEKQQALNELLQNGQNVENMADTAAMYKQVQELWESLDTKTPEALEEAINENFVQKDLTRAKEIGSLISSGEDIHFYDDGTIGIKISKWDDAHKISEESYVQQMKEVEERAVYEQIANMKAQGLSDEQIKEALNLPDTSIHHMNESVKHTWITRGLIGTNETLTQKIANKIGKFYKDKFQINNNIKVEFVDGLTNSKGKAVEGRTEMATYLGKAKKTTNQTSIDKQKLRIKELEDKITQVEGGNKEVSDPLDTLKEKLRIAKEDLKNLQTKAEKDYDIIIRIDKNAKNPYATLRSEIEHARDMAKGEVPKKANIEGSGEHFSRYIGDNEQEMSRYYTYKKSVGKAKALGEETPSQNFMKDGQNPLEEVKYKQETTDGQQGTTTTTANTRKQQKAEAVRRFVEGAARNNDSGSYGNGLFVQRDNLWVVNESKGDLFDGANVSKASYQELPQTTEAGQQFADALSNAKKNLGADGENVDVHPAEDYTNAKTFLSEDGLSGVAVTQDGEIISLFVDPSAKVVDGRGRGRALIELAKQNGGTKLNCYDVGLPDYYKTHGFSETNRMKWDDAYWDKEKWHKELHSQHNNGEPDIVEMELKKEQSLKPTEEPQQLSINFEQAKFQQDLAQATSAKEIVEGLTNGSITPQTVNDIASILEHTIKTDPDLLATDFNSLAMGGDNIVKTLDDLIEAGEANQYKKAFLQDDIEFLNSIVRKELAASKIVGLLKENLNNLPKDASMDIKRNLLNTTVYLSDYVNQLRSGAGSLLNGQKLVNRTLEAFGESRTSSVFKQRIDTIAEVLDNYINEVKQSLDFTQKDVDSYLEGFYNRLSQIEGGEDLIRQIASDDMLKDLFNGIATNPKSTDKKTIAKQLQQAFTDYEYDKLMEALEKTNNPNSIMNVINKWWSNNINAFYVHNILGIGSIFRNVISVARMFGNPIAKRLSGLFGSEFDAISKEGSYTLANMWTNMGEAWSMAKNAFMTGSGQLSNVNEALAVQGLDGLSEWSITPKNIHSLCSRLMMASDEFLTQLNYRAITRAQAQVAVENEFKTSGRQIGTQEFFEAVQKRFEDMSFDSNGVPQNFNAYAEARDLIYQTPLSGKLYDPVTKKRIQVKDPTILTSLSSKAENFVHENPIAKLFLPFIKTPTNVAQSVIDSNPALLAISPNFWRAFNSSDLRERAMARGALTLAGMGSLICSMAAMTGMITGSPPASIQERKALLRTGWQPYSIKIGDKYYSYAFFPPEIKAHIAWGCDIVNIMSNITDDDLDVQEKMGKITGQVIGSLVDTAIDQSSFRTGFSNFTQFMDAIATQDENALIRIMTQSGRGFLPMASTVRDIETLGQHPARAKEGLDPYSTLVMNYFPECFGWAKKANYRRNVFGERQDYFNFIVGKTIEDSHNLPESRAVAELMALGYNPKQVTKTIAGTRISFNNYRNTETGRTAYDDMQEKMSTIKIGGKTLREAIRNLIQTPYYQGLPNGDSKAIGDGRWLKADGDTKMKLMNDIFIEYAEAAEDEVLYDSNLYVDENNHTMEETKEQIENLKEQERINSLMNIGNLY